MTQITTLINNTIFIKRDKYIDILSTKGYIKLLGFKSKYFAVRIGKIYTYNNQEKNIRLNSDLIVIEENTLNDIYFFLNNKMR